jgi:hypothetical protein
MALVRCIVGKFLGVVCHCFPPRLDVPTFAARYLHVHDHMRDPSSERWNYGGECCPVILPKWRLPCHLGIFYMPQIYDMGPTAYTSFKWRGTHLAAIAHIFKTYHKIWSTLQLYRPSFTKKVTNIMMFACKIYVHPCMCIFPTNGNIYAVCFKHTYYIPHVATLWAKTKQKAAMTYAVTHVSISFWYIILHLN